MSNCCAHPDEHNYCCECSDGEIERVRSMIEDVLDGSYDGDADDANGQRVDFPGIPYPTEATEAIIAVLIYEGVL